MVKSLFVCVFLALFLVVPGCKTKKGNDNHGSAKAKNDNSSAKAGNDKAEPGAGELAPTEIEWTPHEVKRIGLTILKMRGTSPQEGTLSQYGYLRQRRGPLLVSVWFGPGAAVKNWRVGQEKRGGTAVGKEKKLQICGVEAVLQEVEIPARHIPDGRPVLSFEDLQLPMLDPSAPKAPADLPRAEKKPPPRDTPKRIGVAVGFERNGTPVRVTWIIDADQRESFRDAEKRFFAALKCD